MKHQNDSQTRTSRSNTTLLQLALTRNDQILTSPEGNTNDDGTNGKHAAENGGNEKTTTGTTCQIQKRSRVCASNGLVVLDLLEGVGG